MRDFENAGDDEDDFVEDELYQEFLNQHGGKFGEEVKKHSYPATVVVRDLQENFSRDRFAQYLQKNKISIKGKYFASEVHFRVENWEEAEQFLEISGHVFEGAKYKLELHGESYKNFEQTKKESDAYKSKKSQEKKEVIREQNQTEQKP